MFHKLRVILFKNTGWKDSSMTSIFPIVQDYDTRKGSTHYVDSSSGLLRGWIEDNAVPYHPRTHVLWFVFSADRFPWTDQYSGSLLPVPGISPTDDDGSLLSDSYYVCTDWWMGSFCSLWDRSYILCILFDCFPQVSFPIIANWKSKNGKCFFQNPQNEISDFRKVKIPNSATENSNFRKKIPKEITRLLTYCSDIQSDACGMDAGYQKVSNTISYS